MSTLLLEHLIDDAALFPPGSAPMPLAVAVHRAVKVGPLGWLVGRFVCPASRVVEAIEQLHPGDAFAVALVADTGIVGLPVALSQVRAEERLALLAVEAAVPAGPDLVGGVRETLAALPTDVRCYLELPRVPQWQSALAVIAAEGGRGVKLRTGGAKAKAFPSEREVADFIAGCVTAGVPFKCSAGLHRAVRHSDRRRRFEHHGFLNIALAACAAVQGDDPLPVLAERDAETVAAAIRDLDEETVSRARSLYAGFGSCSIAEPAGDLLALGLLDGGT